MTRRPLSLIRRLLRVLPLALLVMAASALSADKPLLAQPAAPGKPDIQYAQAQAVADFYVVNRSGQNISELYVSPVEDRNWGQDRLGRAVLPSGRRFLVRLPRDGRCAYDVRVVYENGRAEERRRQDLCGIEQLTFTGAGSGANGGQAARPGKPGASSAAPSGGVQQVVVENRSRRVIEQLYVSPVTDNVWGRDRLGQNVLPSGRRLVVRLEIDTCEWDLMAVYQGGDREEKRRVNLCQTPTIAFTAAAVRPPRPDDQPGRNGPGQRPDAGAASYGTGFFVTPDGHLLTNKHVIESCRAVNATLDGQLVPAQVVAVDRQQDLALLRINRNSPDVATFRGGRRVRAGEEVVVAGFPLRTILADEMNVTLGNVSALAGIGGDAATLQMTAPVQPGNSGGPLFDLAGNVVGVVVAKLNARLVESRTGDIPQNINFAIHAAEARRFLGEHNLQVREAPSDRDLSAADVGDRARRFTVPISCRR